MSSVKKYLLLFAQDYVEFRYPEIESILKVFNINVKVPRVEPIERPYWILEMSEQDVRKIASRSVSIKFVAEFWTSGNTLDEFHENARNYVKFVDKSYSTQSFKFIVESFNKHLKLPERIERIETLTYFDKAFGAIDLINPVNKFVYFEHHGLMNNMPELEEIIIGKWITDGQRDLINGISLKERKFIGNTSMSAHLSLLMANQGLCKENELMFDPFVGTGSLLVAAAWFGSYVMGADIDYLTLHAKTKPVRAWKKSRESDESVKANFEQYNLLHRYLDVYVGDFSNCPLRSNLIFDAIVCDPPYGVREAMSKIENKERRMKLTAMTEDAVHYPSLSSYKVSNLYSDLFAFSMTYLKMNGRLVMWFPVPDKAFDESTLPQHTAMKLIASSRQQLIGETSRFLLTYEKIADHGESVQTKEVDFRATYFTQYEHKKKEKEREYKHNQEEAAKRGNKIITRKEWKQHENKKRHFDQE